MSQLNPNCTPVTIYINRTCLSLQYFPRVFFLMFTLFNIYFFSFPVGFSYLCLLTTVLFVQHSMLFFWNRYEVPALVRLPCYRNTWCSRVCMLDYISRILYPCSLGVWTHQPSATPALCCVLPIRAPRTGGGGTQTRERDSFFSW